MRKLRSCLYTSFSEASTSLSLGVLGSEQVAEPTCHSRRLSSAGHTHLPQTLGDPEALYLAAAKALRDSSGRAAILGARVQPASVVSSANLGPARQWWCSNLNPFYSITLGVILECVAPSLVFSPFRDSTSNGRPRLVSVACISESSPIECVMCLAEGPERKQMLHMC